MLVESECVELKKSTGELEQAIISIVAMLNKHQKGNLYFGIKDSGEPVGQQISNQTLRDVSKIISENIEPKIYPTVSRVIIQDKECIHVGFEGNDLPYFAFGRAYMRVGDEDRQITQKEIKNIILKIEEKNNRWEERASNIGYEDIDEDTLKNFVKKGIKNVYNMCREDKINIKFENRKTAFFVVVYRKDLDGLVENTEKKLNKNVGTNVGTNVGINDTQNKILSVICQNSNITQKEIADKLNITLRTVERNINNLKQIGILERIGANKNGYWKIK